MTNLFPRAALALALVFTLGACQAESEYAVDDVQEMSVATTEADVALEAEPATPGVVQPTSLQSDIDVPEPSSRLLIRTGLMTIRADNHTRAVERARALADATGGFIGGESSRRYSDRVETTLTIRVPATRFDSLLEGASGIAGEIESRSVSVDDVTRQVADVEARLGARRAAETQYLELMQRSGSIEDVLAVQARLQEVREQIESAEAQLRAMRDQVSLSTLTLTLFEASAAGITSGPGFFAQAGRAIVDGWDGLLELALGLLTIWPMLLLIAGAIWLVVRLRTRRRARASS
ncbi:DUF4349 domain-containing protein [Rubrivirga sp.]|uniref:DUF4349 domain-containing protein n=1 Tax=Rubrivirga sp. TaxID=1885344 RepID=UPI003C7454A4